MKTKMTKYKKNKTLILQKIRLRKSLKLFSTKKKKKFKKQSIEPARNVRTPRRFLRYHISVSSTQSKKGNNSFYHKKEHLIQKYLPINLKYLLFTEESPFYLDDIRKENFNSLGVVYLPDNFSIIDNPKESYLALRRFISALLIEDNQRVSLNYINCKKIGLGSQVLLDIILMDFLKFANKCQKIDRNKISYFPSTIGGDSINEENVQKLIFSVGSPVILNIGEKVFPDIVRYKLCTHNNIKERNIEKRMEQKELDTTEMVDYVINCLKRMKKKLTSEKLNDLCTVIGEILINAEEHSTTKHRFSIGYFQEENTEENHFGIFRLVILNFGQTIYEKFKSEDSPNKDIINKMKELSSSYIKRNLFFKREFEEENLWTLYALQEGVTSIPYDKYKRGNGSIRFIESFFNIKGSEEADNISKMTIISGKTQISFDGRYNIVPKLRTNSQTFKVMSFNESGNIEEKPDSKSVICNENYFPGTIISAKILLNDDDLKLINN